MVSGAKNPLAMRGEHVRRRVESGESYAAVSSGGVGRDAELGDDERQRARAALADAVATVAGNLPWAEDAGGLRLEDRQADGPHYPRTLHVGDRLVAAFSDSWVLDRIEQGEEALVREVADRIERSGIERYLRKRGELDDPNAARRQLRGRKEEAGEKRNVSDSCG